MRKLNLNIEEDLFLVPENHDGSWPVCEHPAIVHSRTWNNKIRLMG